MAATLLVALRILAEGMGGSCSNCFNDGISGITIEDCSEVFEDFFAPDNEEDV